MPHAQQNICLYIYDAICVLRWSFAYSCPMAFSASALVILSPRSLITVYQLSHAFIAMYCTYDCISTVNLVVIYPIQPLIPNWQLFVGGERTSNDMIYGGAREFLISIMDFTWTDVVFSFHNGSVKMTGLGMLFRRC